MNGGQSMAVDVTIHLNDLQEMVIGEYADTFGMTLEECFKNVMEGELDEYLASLGVLIDRTPDTAARGR